MLRQHIAVILGLIFAELRNMKKYWLVIIILFCAAKEGFANHTKGGWMYYEYLGPGSSANSSRYNITLKVYTECVLNPGQADATAGFTIFNAATLAQVSNISVALSEEENINNCTLPSCHPCINNIPAICYKIRTFSTVVELTNSPSGYIVSYQRCCRISGIVNVQNPSNNFGETWTVTIPGTAVTPGSHTNTSAKFSQNDTAIICQNSFFTFDFTATDINNDSLVYDFVPAYAGATSGAPNPAVSSPPPFPTLAYSGGYSGGSPLGGAVTINRNTGIVSGVAPGQGVYVVTVRVSEYKRGTNIKIAEVRKSLHIQVTNCSLTDAKLDPEYTSCDGFTVTFFNFDNNNIQTFEWSFGDGNISNLPSPTHTYADTGRYTLKLVVNRGLACSDSATAIVKVYPGYFPDFDVLGQCKNTPIQFNDRTTANFGTVNFWRWNFGDIGSPTNTSTLQNPTHVYANTGQYDVTLIVASDKGCIDTVPKTITITDKPALSAGNDTLICSIDTLQLNAVGTGTFLWQPNYMISSLTVPNPFVSPNITTDYIVTLTDPFGCVGNDTIRVNVVDFVTQSISPPDTTICRTDPIPLLLNSNALNYQWTETPNNNTLSSTTIKNPIATPLVNTTYTVTGSIGKCIAQNTVTIRPVPYPAANAGPDTVTCFGRSVQLNASGGSNYLWTPSVFLNNRFIPNPVAVNPTASVRYIVTVTDILGCPKTSRDTVFLTVDQIIADAGPSDTSVVLGQPLLLTATGSTNYLWSPATWLNNIAIATPVSLPQNNITYRVRVSNNVGCFAEDTIRVTVYFIAPGFNVPNAFTPNGDGRNDRFRPIAIGMKSIDVFRVYNRWGQLVHSDNNIEKGNGWDGAFRGKAQDPGTYVWYAEGTDYQNIKVKRKGSVVLIRE